MLRNAATITAETLKLKLIKKKGETLLINSVHHLRAVKASNRFLPGDTHTKHTSPNDNNNVCLCRITRSQVIRTLL